MPPGPRNQRLYNFWGNIRGRTQGCTNARHVFFLRDTTTPSYHLCSSFPLFHPSSFPVHLKLHSWHYVTTPHPSVSICWAVWQNSNTIVCLHNDWDWRKTRSGSQCPCFHLMIMNFKSAFSAKKKKCLIPLVVSSRWLSYSFSTPACLTLHSAHELIPAQLLSPVIFSPSSSFLIPRYYSA